MAIDRVETDQEWRTVLGQRILVPKGMNDFDAIRLLAERQNSGVNVQSGLPPARRLNSGSLSRTKSFETGLPSNVESGFRLQGESLDINETLLKEVTDAYISGTLKNIAADEPSSILQAELSVDLERGLRRAGLRGVDIANEANRIISNKGLADAAEQRGMRFGEFGWDDNVEDNMLRIKDMGVNDGGQLLWNRNGLLQVDGTQVDKYIEEQKALADETARRIGGGGRSGPVYVRPDEDLVRDWVRGQMRTRIGTVNESRVEYLKDIFMRDHRKDFDNKGQQIDAQQAVKEAIRKFSDYQEIHANRPDNIDDESWLPQFIANQAKQGLNADVALERGKVLATAGDATVDASAFQAQRTGRAPAFIQQASAVAGVIGNTIR